MTYRKFLEICQCPVYMCLVLRVPAMLSLMIVANNVIVEVWSYGPLLVSVNKVLTEIAHLLTHCLWLFLLNKSLAVVMETLYPISLESY